MLDLFRTLPGLMRDIDGAEAVRAAVVFAAWRRVAGENLAEHAVPVRLDSAKLIVAVSSVTWQRHLKDLAGQMLFKLNATLGAPLVSYLEFEIDEAAVAEVRKQLRPVDDTDLRREAERMISPELMNAAEKIEDTELRRQFLLAAGNCLVRRKRARSGPGA